MFPVTNQLLAQLDLLRYWKEPQPTRTMSTSCRNSSMTINDIQLPAIGADLIVLTHEQADCKGVKDEGHFKGEHCSY